MARTAYGASAVYTEKTLKAYSRLGPLIALSLVGAAVACDNGEDARTAMVTPGISRDSALAVLRSPIAGEGQVSIAGDSLKNVWRVAQYLVGGQIIDVIWYSRDDERRTAADTVPEGKVVPIVLAEGKVVGVGRSVHDSVAKAAGIPKNKY